MNDEVTKEALNNVINELIPKEITKETIIKYVTKARRIKAWHKLPKEMRALLIIASKTIKQAKSQTLKQILQKAFMNIELQTLKGKALLIGYTIKITQKLSHLNPLYLGINYLNNPPQYRAINP